MENRKIVLPENVKKIIETLQTHGYEAYAVGGCVRDSVLGRIPQDWDITVCIPDFELSTNIARSVLPEQIPMQDAIFNAKHLAMLVEAVNTKDTKLMKIALQDKLHQPYREKLVPGMREIMEAFKHEDGVLGCVLSGAGPTMLIISHKYDVDKIKSTVREIWEGQSIKTDIRTLKIEPKGAEILEA